MTAPFDDVASSENTVGGLLGPGNDTSAGPLGPVFGFLKEVNATPQVLVKTLQGLAVEHEDTFKHLGEMPRRDPLSVVIPITVVYALIFLLGILGNVSTCIVIARNKHMHTATNYYLFSLAVSDLLLLVSGLPPEMYYIWSRYPYVFGEAFCVIQGFAAETSANATVLTITAFTVERYVAICHPFQSHTMSKLSRAVKFVVAIWVMALCLAVPQAIQFGVVLGRNRNGTELEELAQCTVKWELLDHAFEISTFVFFVAPMTVITVLYILIGIKLRRSRLLTATKRSSVSSANDRGAADVGRGNRAASHQNYVIKMLVAVVVAFFICWAPFHAQRLLAVYARSKEEPGNFIQTVYTILTYISGIFYYLSTTVNPVLYHIMSNKFRDAFRSTLAQQCGRGKKRAMSRRTYSVLSRGYNCPNHQLCHTNNVPVHLHRLNSVSEDAQSLHAYVKPPPPASIRLHLRHNSINLDEDPARAALLDRRQQCRSLPATCSTENVNNCPIRQRQSSNSSQATVTTSLSKISIGEGNTNSVRSDGAVFLDDIKPHHTVFDLGHSARNSKLNTSGVNGLKTVVGSTCKDINSTDLTKPKLKCKCEHCGAAKSNGIVTITGKCSLFKAPPRTSAIGVLARKLRSFPGTAIFSPQQKILVKKLEVVEGPPGVVALPYRLASHASLDSANTNTISNSSLQDMDETEFIGAELAHYMGELNQQRQV